MSRVTLYNLSMKPYYPLIMKLQSGLQVIDELVNHPVVRVTWAKEYTFILF